MSAFSSYTDLETLLLFQSLGQHGLESSSFPTISEEIKGNPYVRDDPSYSEGRLNPDALRDLYLQLLKEEVKVDLQKALDREAGVDTPSRKRKAPSPSLPTVQDAIQHAHLIPQLIQRLYARWRDHLVDEIREDERAYDQYQIEIKEIEAGTWDGKLSREKDSLAATFDAKRDGRQTENHTGEAVQDIKDDNDASTSPKIENLTVDEDVPIDLPKESKHVPRTSIDGLINHTPDGTRAPSPARLTSSTTASTGQPLPPIKQPSPLGTLESNKSLSPTPRLPPPQPTGQGYRLSTSPSQAPSSLPPIQPPASYSASPPLPGSTPPNAGQPVSPQPPSTAIQQSGQASALPGILSQNPYRASTGPSSQQYSPSPPRYPVTPVQPGGVSPVIGGAHYNTAPQQRSGYPPYTGRAQPYPPSQPPPISNYPPPVGGYQLPPFQVNAQDPIRAHMQQMIAQQQQQTTSPSPQQASRLPTQESLVKPAISSYPSGDDIRQILQRPSVRSRLSSYKAIHPPSAPKSPPKSPERPLPEQASPVKKHVPKPAPIQTLDKRTRGKRKASEEITSPDGETTPSGRRSAAPPPRKSTRRTRGGSVSSSAMASSARGRSRSQSVISHTADEEGEGDEDDDERPTKKEPGEETPKPTRRTRAGTLRPEALPSAITNRGKRKRDISISVVDSPAARLPLSSREGSAPPTSTTPLFASDTVNAVRNFTRLSAPLLSDISSHKYASYFNQPVRPSQAAGYTDIIKRPTDLKTIRALITSGSRALAAATAMGPDSPAPTPGSASTPTASTGVGVVPLPKTADLLPPKAIVNAAQLEQEIVRIFANAVMFNPGDDGIVRDARAMFEDVQPKIATWRAAEESGAGSRNTTAIAVQGTEEEMTSSAAPPEDEEDANAGDAAQETGRGKRRRL